jgi:hypothetical protein
MAFLFKCPILGYKKQEGGKVKTREKVREDVVEMIKDMAFRIYCYDDDGGDDDATGAMENLAEEIEEEYLNHFSNLELDVKK